ncbi:MAG: nuclear transport factor 2 family protein [Steroidobacteraceae bacterium]
MPATNDLEARLRRIEDRMEIGELVTRYGLAMDDRDVAALDGLFTPDVRIWSADGVMDASGFDRVVEMFRGRFAVLGPSNHFTHDRLVTFDEADADRATGLVLSHAEMQRRGQPMLAAIRYHDVYQRSGGRWKFRERGLSFMYYVPTAEYLDAMGPGIALRNRAYDEPRAADWPESLPTWRRYHGG